MLRARARFTSHLAAKAALMTSLCFLEQRAFAAETLGTALPALPESAKLIIEETWDEGKLDSLLWYSPRTKWGGGNHGVSPDNVRFERDAVFGKKKNVLVCQAHGDLYDGEVVGYGGNKTRVGSVIISKEFFASGRFEVVMKIGGKVRASQGPEDPMRPSGAIPAVWTYAYRFVKVDEALMDQFVPDVPLYNPFQKAYDGGFNEYWSELDFPEFGKEGQFDTALYNTFLNQKHDSKTYDVRPMIDGDYHVLTTEWRTELRLMKEIKDAHVRESEGVYWIQDSSIPFETYWGSPLKKLGPDSYALYTGQRADHYLDGKKVAENRTYVPCMAAQLTLGVWLPHWAGPARWKSATVSFASVHVWQFYDEGDVRGILKSDIQDSYRKDGTPLK